MIRLVKQIKQNLFDGYDNDCWDKTFVVCGKEIRLLDNIQQSVMEVER